MTSQEFDTWARQQLADSSATATLPEPEQAAPSPQLPAQPSGVSTLPTALPPPERLSPFPERPALPPEIGELIRRSSGTPEQNQARTLGNLNDTDALGLLLSGTKTLAARKHEETLAGMETGLASEGVPGVTTQELAGYGQAGVSYAAKPFVEMAQGLTGVAQTVTDALRQQRNPTLEFEGKSVAQVSADRADLFAQRNDAERRMDQDRAAGGSGSAQRVFEINIANLDNRIRAADDYIARGGQIRPPDAIDQAMQSGSYGLGVAHNAARDFAQNLESEVPQNIRDSYTGRFMDLAGTVGAGLALGPLGEPVVAGSIAAQLAGQNENAALRAGATPDQARSAAVLGAAGGLAMGPFVESIRGGLSASETLATFLRTPEAREMARILQPYAGMTAKEIGLDMAKGVTTGVVSQAGLQVWNNLSARLSGYNPNQPLTEGVLEQAALGAMFEAAASVPQVPHLRAAMREEAAARAAALTAREEPPAGAAAAQPVPTPQAPAGGPAGGAAAARAPINTEVPATTEEAVAQLGANLASVVQAPTAAPLAEAAQAVRETQGKTPEEVLVAAGTAEEQAARTREELASQPTAPRQVEPVMAAAEVEAAPAAAYVPPTPREEFQVPARPAPDVAEPRWAVWNSLDRGAQEIIRSGNPEAVASFNQRVSDLEDTWTRQGTPFIRSGAPAPPTPRIEELRPLVESVLNAGHESTQELVSDIQAWARHQPELSASALSRVMEEAGLLQRPDPVTEMPAAWRDVSQAELATASRELATFLAAREQARARGGELAAQAPLRDTATIGRRPIPGTGVIEETPPGTYRAHSRTLGRSDEFQTEIEARDALARAHAAEGLGLIQRPAEAAALRGGLAPARPPRPLNKGEVRTELNRQTSAAGLDHRVHYVEKAADLPAHLVAELTRQGRAQTAQTVYDHNLGELWVIGEKFNNATDLHRALIEELIPRAFEGLRFPTVTVDAPNDPRLGWWNPTTEAAVVNTAALANRAHPLADAGKTAVHEAVVHGGFSQLFANTLEGRETYVTAMRQVRRYFDSTGIS